MARTELLDVRPEWPAAGLDATSILLEPLSRSDAARLVDDLLAGGVDEARTTPPAERCRT